MAREGSTTGMHTDADIPIGQLIRSARQQLHMSQYDLAKKLAAVAGNSTMGRDRVARWERGRQVPRAEWRRWLSVVLRVPEPELDAGAAEARRRTGFGDTHTVPNPAVNMNNSAREQGSYAQLPVFRSRVQAAIMAATLLNPTRAFSLAELARYVGASPTAVSRQVGLLEAAGILTRQNEDIARPIRAVTDRPMIGPLTDLICVTFGVPQVIRDEFGRIPGITHVAVDGIWCERFTGIPGYEPGTVQLRLTAHSGALDEQELTAAARRAEKRIHRPVRYSIAPVDQPSTTGTAIAIPQQRGGRPIVDVAAIPPSSDQSAIVTPGNNGDTVVQQLLDDGQLELTGGADTESAELFGLADVHLDSAETIAPRSATSAFLLICQAAQEVGSGLLARQGLEPTKWAAPNVVSHTVTAQFGPRFSHIELLRRRQAELSMPTSRDNRAKLGDVDDYLPTVRALLASGRDIARTLGPFT